MKMTRLSTHQFQNDMVNAINRVSQDGERILLHKNKKKLAAIVPIEDFELLEAMEDQADLQAARAALAEGGERIPAAEVKRLFNIK
ncbi:MAG TPA: type II toxin-antitoxin system Phd/YefM family antitoxin [Candidatus Hydrogenedentes bacterium]|nr:type II toxin-antitoxin system Phd/YefM family antitoxin [Candidatus Hydrogenedentota bacterium]